MSNWSFAASSTPALERAIGSRLHQAGVRALVAKFPTPTTLRSAGRTRINRTIKARSPRLADKVTNTVIEALDAQSVVLPAETALGRVIAEVAAELDRLKNATFLVAFASLRSPESKTFYDRKRSEGKKHNASLICLARRRTGVILAMLREQQPYRPPTAPAPQLNQAA